MYRTFHLLAPLQDGQAHIAILIASFCASRRVQWDAPSTSVLQGGGCTASGCRLMNAGEQSARRTLFSRRDGWMNGLTHRVASDQHLVGLYQYLQLTHARGGHDRTNLCCHAPRGRPGNPIPLVPRYSVCYSLSLYQSCVVLSSQASMQQQQLIRDYGLFGRALRRRQQAKDHALSSFPVTLLQRFSTREETSLGAATGLQPLTTTNMQRGWVGLGWLHSYGHMTRGCTCVHT